MKKVLFVEDDEINQVIIKGILGAIGYKDVQMANNAAQALSILENPDSNIDVILMDIGLPDMDGIALTEKIRHSDLAAKNVPIIAVTGNNPEKAKEKSIAAGMNAFLTKPINQALLEKTLKEIFEA